MYVESGALVCSMLLEERLDIVEVLFSDLSLRRNVQLCLKAMPDYFRLTKKINRGKGTLQVSSILQLLDVCKEYQIIYPSVHVIGEIASCSNNLFYFFIFLKNNNIKTKHFDV